MKKNFLVVAGLSLLITTAFPATSNAQCNPGELYDNIVSGWHQSIAKKSDGSLVVWGNTAASDGVANVLSPIALNAANYSALGAATPMRGAIGGKGSSSKSQLILLASDGLYAWGSEDNVVETSLTGSSAFAKFTAPVGSNAGNNLPAGVNPSDIRMITASYQTLVLLTNNGYVWVLTQLSANLQGSGDGLAATTWKKVKINSTTDLTNVVSVRCQASSATNNAMIAMTADGTVYVWGTTVYLGNTSDVTSKNYATPVTRPAEFNAGNIPKMIAVTGATNVRNTFFLLSKNGSLYALGDNSGRQCGDFTTAENKSWVNVEQTDGVNFTDVNFITAMESDISVPAVAAITQTGKLYTWGLNEKFMIGRTADATTYNPGIPAGFNIVTDKAISAEMGGHTLVYIKEGSTQYCYVGHRINGSMGDNTTAENNEASFNCSGTPVLQTCGSVPVAASAVTSVISVSNSLIAANGITTSTITIRLKDAAGNFLTTSGGIVTISTSAGVLGTVLDNNDGTYTAILTSDNDPATADISFSINGTLASATASVVFASTLPLSWGDVSAYRKYKTQQVQWFTEQETMVSHFALERSLNGRDWSVILDKKQAQNGNYRHAYYYTDNEYIPGTVYYRIKEVDIDGKFSYSPVIFIEADPGFNRIIAYPSPTDKTFYIGNISKEKISNVSIYTINGELVKAWSQPASIYTITEIPTGIYIIKVTTTDGSVQNIRIKKI